jgi:hypothetical protein
METLRATSWPGCDRHRPSYIRNWTVREPIAGCYNELMRRNSWFEPLVSILICIVEAIIGNVF